MCLLFNEANGNRPNQQHIVLELTYQCPLSCKHCVVNTSDATVMDELLLKSIIKDLQELPAVTVHLTGGEPMLHPQFKETLQTLLNSNVNVNVTTTGYINDADIENLFKQITPEKGYIQVGLDGLEKTHVEMRGMHDAFKKSMAFVRRMIGGKVKVAVALTCANQRFDEMDELCNYLKILGVSVIKLGVSESFGRAAIDNARLKACELLRVRSFGDYLKDKYENAAFKIEYEKGENMMQETWQSNCGDDCNLLIVDPKGYIRKCMLTKNTVGRVTTANSLSDFLLASSKTE